jgi:succinate dehydrogenase flavin-adding protein (antitoxin of CptAB toxin-antitoxin module)
MTGLTRTSEGLDPRRRRMLFRAWHRGMREMAARGARPRPTRWNG